MPRSFVVDAAVVFLRCPSSPQVTSTRIEPTTSQRENRVCCFQWDIDVYCPEIVERFQSHPTHKTHAAAVTIESRTRWVSGFRSPAGCGAFTMTVVDRLSLVKILQPSSAVWDLWLRSNQREGTIELGLVVTAAALRHCLSHG